MRFGHLATTLGAVALLATVSQSATVSVLWNNEKQEIDGFGAAIYKGKLFSSDAASLDLMFSRTNGMGFSIVRTGVAVGGECEGNNPIADQILVAKEAQNRSSDVLVISCPWSPPGSMKSNGSSLNGGSLNTGSYQAYADILADFANNVKAQGVNLLAVSIQNEPDLSTAYCSANYDGNQFKAFTHGYLKPTFDRKGVTAKIMMGDKCGWSEDIALPTLNDPASVNDIDYVSAHYYCGNGGPFTTSLAKGKKVWQSEICNMGSNDQSMNDAINWASDIFDFLSNKSASAWLYWCFIHPTNDYGIIKSAGTTTRRLYAMGNYSRYVRPGYYRIETTPASQGNVLVSAYKNRSTGAFAIVAVNKNGSSASTTFALDFGATTVTPHLTTSSENLSTQPNINVSNRSFTATLPGMSVTTFTGVGGATSVSARHPASPSGHLTGVVLYNLRGSKVGHVAHRNPRDVRGIAIAVPNTQGIEHRSAVLIVQ